MKKLTYVVLFSLSFASLIAMDDPREGMRARGQAAGRAASRTAGLAALSAEFAANAQRLHAQAEANANADKGVLGEVEDIFTGLFGGGEAKAAPAQDDAQRKSQPQAVQVDNDIATLNRLFKDWKNDPTNLNKRQAVCEFQVFLTSKYASLSNQNPALFKKLNGALIAIDTQGSQITEQKRGMVADRAYYVDPQPKAPHAPQKYSDDDINNAMARMHNSRIKKANQYYRYGLVSAVGVVGLSALAFYKGSKEAAAGATVCAITGSYCAWKNYRLAQQPTRQEAIALLEQRQRRN